MAQKTSYWTFGLTALFAVPGAYGVDYDYSLYSSAEYSDNIRQGAAGADVEGSILTGGLGFGLRTDENATLAADVDADIARYFYSEGSLEDENRGRLDASLLFQPSNTNFRLAVLDSYYQVREDRRDVARVNNLRNVNIFSVVPSYHIDLSSVSRIRGSYSYSTIYDELDLASRDVEGVNVGYEYKVSNLSDWSINAGRSETEFTDTGQTVEQENVFFRWNYQGLLTNWMLDLGQQRLLEAEGAEETMVNFSIGRAVNNSSRVGLFYSRGYSDVVNTTASERLIQMVPNGDVVFADEFAREEQVTLSYDYNRGGLGGNVSLSGRTLESEEAVSVGRFVDEDRYGLSLGVNYRFRDHQYNLSPWGIATDYRYVDERFNREDEENQINEAAVRLNYFATRSTNVYFELRSRNTSGTAAVSDTDERAALVGFIFSPRGGE